ncbi:hypothetical protein FA10DRAFT_265676 [Acaromyces ingoldii]|uniref:Uncharacterized protein n=1 Tax=Acaromyces ingoldii TaxID=215250 RepID=A0A316YRU6_9BASI|nr:hypothetical protein FA10DRAFT_265676 [Acaromyces ingoldii]PWN91842.1 hypothetical protein FA10DRAFT_265676 [Acaromyces ingoldii]
MARFFFGVASTVLDAIGFFSSLHSSSLELLRKVALASISSSSERLRFLLVTTILKQRLKWERTYVDVLGKI